MTSHGSPPQPCCHHTGSLGAQSRSWTGCCSVVWAGRVTGDQDLGSHLRSGPVRPHGVDGEPGTSPTSLLGFFPPGGGAVSTLCARCVASGRSLHFSGPPSPQLGHGPDPHLGAPRGVRDARGMGPSAGPRHSGAPGSSAAPLLPRRVSRLLFNHTTNAR